MASRRRRHSNATIELLPGNRHTLPYDPETTTNFYLPDSSHSFGINIKSLKKKTIVNLHVIQPKPEFPERPISERDKSKVTETKPDFSEKPISERETSTVTQHKPEFSERPISDRETSTENNQSEQPTEKSTNQYAPVGNPSPQPDSDSGNGNKNPSISSSESDGNTDPPERNLDLPVAEKKRYNNLFGKLIDEKDMTYLDELVKNIGNTDRHKYAEYQLKVLTEKFDDKNTDESVKKKIKTYVNDFYVKKEDNTRLLHAAAIHENPTGDQQLIKSLLKLCPGQVTEKRTGSNEGQNVLHMLVYNKNFAGAKHILKSRPDVSKLLSSKAKCRLLKTRMMGETPLFIAVLSFDNEMIHCLIDKGGVGLLTHTTSQGYTVFHLLVRYAAICPESKKDAKEMMEKLNTILQNDKRMIKKLVKLWQTQDNDGLTVLQLAAFLGQFKIYKWIMKLKDISYKYFETEYIHGHVRYDVSEIDSVALDISRFPESIWMTRRTNPKLTLREHTPERPRPQSAPQSSYKSRDIDATSFSSLSKDCPLSQSAPHLTYEESNMKRRAIRSPSVIEIACETKKTKGALKLIDNLLFDDIIDTKWRKYRKWFYGSLCLYFVSMALIIAQILIKEKLIRNTQQQIPTSDAPVITLSIVLFMIGLILLFQECVRLSHGHQLCFFTLHHNGTYRVLLIVFSFCLMADSIWYWITIPDNNYFLLISLVVGGWFFPFFLRPWEFYSFFTTMLRHALLADSIRFFPIILLEFATFSFVMYFLFLPTPGGPPEEFENLNMTALTMFKMMVGVSDLSFLTGAPYNDFPSILSVLYILVTNVFLINSFIAMMSRTYNEDKSSKRLHCKLQTLSVIMMIESTFLFRHLACQYGEKEDDRFLSEDVFLEDKTKTDFHKLDEDMIMKYLMERSYTKAALISSQTNASTGITVLRKPPHSRRFRIPNVKELTPVD